MNNEAVIKLLLAVLVGGAIGMERELRSKSAGFRTLMLICVGATLFTIFSQQLGAHTSPDRIASNVVVGIGFLGAGVIFRGGNSRVNGITTATSIWITAALGMGIGSGHYLISIAACFIVLVILFLFPFVETFIDRINQVRDYKIVYPYEENNQHRYEKMITNRNLKIKNRSQSKAGNMLTGSWLVQGKESNHHAFIEDILNDKDVTSFEF